MLKINQQMSLNVAIKSFEVLNISTQLIHVAT